MKAYKTLFIRSEIVTKKVLSMTYEPNGDQLARDVQAALMEQADKGYELVTTTPIEANYQSSYPHTLGVMLIFKAIV